MNGTFCGTLCNLSMSPDWTIRGTVCPSSALSCQVLQGMCRPKCSNVIRRATDSRWSPMTRSGFKIIRAPAIDCFCAVQGARSDWMMLRRGSVVQGWLNSPPPRLILITVRPSSSFTEYSHSRASIWRLVGLNTHSASRPG